METNNTEGTESTHEVVINDPKAVLDALDRAKSDAKKFREEKEKLEIDLNSKDQIIAEYSGKLLREKVTQRMQESGIKDPKRLMRFIDLNSLEFDDNLDVANLDSQLTQLKDDFPELFDPKLRVGGQADGAANTTVSTRISATEMQALKILGKI